MNIISVYFFALTIQRIHVILCVFEWYFPEIFVPRKAAVFCPQDSWILRFAGSHLAPRSIWAWQIKLIKIGWNKVRHEEPTSWNIKINNIHSNASRNEACHRYFFSRNFVDAWKTCHPSWLAQAVGFTVSLEVQFPPKMGGVCSFLRDVSKLHPQNSTQICAAYETMMALT